MPQRAYGYGGQAETFAARHSMDSPEWYTPQPIVEAAREVMGGIDLDPASHAEANERIQATTFYNEVMDGLTLPWSGRVFLNPPGGKDKNGKPLVPQFWAQLVEWFFHGDVTQVIWIGYSLEQLQTLQNQTKVTPLDFSMCVPRKRIAFIENEAKKAARITKQIAAGKSPTKGDQPSHGNYITYMGIKKGAFAQVFEPFGHVVLR